MATPTLSLCMIVKNEAHQLLNCLASVSSLAPEVIIVDTGSTDNTRELAEQAGARLSSYDFEKVDFASARNLGLSKATAAWILVLDADETLDAVSLPALAEKIAQDENTGYYLERHNYASDSDSTTIDHVGRLFPNRAGYRYRGRVHETIQGRLVPSNIRIQHHFVTDRKSRRRKNHWYIQILKEEIEADPTDDSRLDFLAAEYHQLEMFDEATAVAEQIARLRPNDARAHLFAGTYHLLFKPDFKQARQDFNTALQLQPDYPEAESFLRLLDSKTAPKPPASN